MEKAKLYISKESRWVTFANATQQFYSTLMEVEPTKKEVIDAVQKAGTELSTALGVAASYLQTRQPEEAVKALDAALESIEATLAPFAEKSVKPEPKKPARKRAASGGAK